MQPRPSVLHLCWARWTHVLGLPGTLGVAMLACAVGLGIGAGLTLKELRLKMALGREIAPSVSALPIESPAEPALPRLAWPSEQGVPALLSRIQRNAEQNGLVWGKAEYVVQEASSRLPGRLEIRTQLTGPYPSVRMFVSAGLRDWPTSTLQELSFKRQSVEAPTVDARLVFVIFLSMDAATEAVR